MTYMSNTDTAKTTRHKGRPKCLACGKECKRRRKYCSKECRKNVRVKKYICAFCSTEFERADWRHPETKKQYCCIEHCLADKRTRTPKKCIACGKEFRIDAGPKQYENAKYCSRECFDNRQKPGPQKVAWRTCLACNKEFWTWVNKSQDKKYCSYKCYWSSVTGENSPRYIDGQGQAPYPIEFNGQLRRSVRKRDNNICVLCKTPESCYNRALSVHHIDYDKTNNNMSNLLSMCRPCHSTTNTSRPYWQQILSELQIKRLQDNDIVRSA